MRLASLHLGGRGHREGHICVTCISHLPLLRYAGRSMVESTLKPVSDERMWFNPFRIGLWPEYFRDSQFPKGEGALDQPEAALKITGR